MNRNTSRSKGEIENETIKTSLLSAHKNKHISKMLKHSHSLITDSNLMISIFYQLLLFFDLHNVLTWVVQIPGR